MRRRQLLIATLSLPAVPLFAKSAAKANHPDAVVSLASPKASAIPTFRSISDALAAAPDNSRNAFRIRIDHCVWSEKLVVDKPNIHLIGSGREHTSIRFDAAAGQRDPQGELWGTWGCASVRVTAAGFMASNISIVNGFDYLGHLREPKLETIGSNGAQAVALMLDKGSDMALIRDCSIVGHQDTLFVDAGRSEFQNCEISGSVDFIFGGGQARFERCELRSRFRPGKERQGYIAAPSTLVSKESGLVFHHCQLTQEADVPPASVALGRAWRPTREFPAGKYGDPRAVGAAAFIRCDMGSHIAVNGWDTMKYTSAAGERVELQPGQARLVEYLNRGPGAQVNSDRPQLSPRQAEELLRTSASFAGRASSDAGS